MAAIRLLADHLGRSRQPRRMPKRASIESDRRHNDLGPFGGLFLVASNETPKFCCSALASPIRFVQCGSYATDPAFPTSRNAWLGGFGGSSARESPGRGGVSPWCARDLRGSAPPEAEQWDPSDHSRGRVPTYRGAHPCVRGTAGSVLHGVGASRQCRALLGLVQCGSGRSLGTHGRGPSLPCRSWPDKRRELTRRCIKAQVLPLRRAAQAWSVRWHSECR